VYVVAGSAGRSGAPVDSSFPHTALPFATSDGGMLYFEVENNRLDAKLIHENGGIFDQFTILKNVSKKSEISVSSGSEVTLTASWPGTYQWSNGATTRSVSITPTGNTTYTVSDANGCLKDTFNVTVTSAVVSRTGAESIAIPEISVEEKVFSAEVYPTPIKRGTAINIKTNKNESVEALVMDVNGRIIASKKFNGTTQVDTRKLAAGVYFIAIRRRGKNEVHQVIVTD
jgi:hypothetical protein